MKGAQPSDSALQLFNSVGLMDRFARYKAGEPKETLLAESKAYFENRKVSPKTRRVAA
jgi:small subunit ribosomal protein S16